MSHNRHDSHNRRLPARIDAALPPSIARAAAPWNTRYTEQQLYYEVCRTLRPVPGLLTHQAALAAGVGLVPSLLSLNHPHRAQQLAAADALIVGALWGIRTMPYTRTLPPCSRADFAAALDRYCTRHGEPDGLLPPVEALTRTAQAAREYDLLDYGVSRVLVCQSPDIAHMLLANMMHMDMKCAIVALADATPLPDTITSMLARSDDAQVFFLHDASAEGLSLAATIARRLAAPDGVLVRAIGLRPAHARRMHLFVTRTPATPAPDEPWLRRLSSHERTWVQQGWCAEVAAISPPDFLLKLRRIISGNSGNAPNPQSLLHLFHDYQAGFMTWPAA